MMTSINGKISYRFGVLNDCFVSSPEPLGPFSRFGYFRLVYICSIFKSADPCYLDEKEE